MVASLRAAVLRLQPPGHCLALAVASSALRGAAAHLSQSDRASLRGRRARVREESPDTAQISAGCSTGTASPRRFTIVVGRRSCDVSWHRKEKGMPLTHSWAEAQGSFLPPVRCRTAPASRDASEVADPGCCLSSHR